MDLTFLHDGRLMYVHEATQCADPLRCNIHHPSSHPLNMAPLHWRDDRRIMERICPHGIGHPDPDDIKVRMDPSERVHGCDGCC